MSKHSALWNACKTSEGWSASEHCALGTKTITNGVHLEFLLTICVAVLRSSSIFLRFVCGTWSGTQGWRPRCFFSQRSFMRCLSAKHTLEPLQLQSCVIMLRIFVFTLEQKGVSEIQLYGHMCCLCSTSNKLVALLVLLFFILVEHAVSWNIQKSVKRGWCIQMKSVSLRWEKRCWFSSRYLKIVHPRGAITENIAKAQYF